MVRDEALARPMKACPLVLTLVDLILADAIVCFLIARGWPWPPHAMSWGETPPVLPYDRTL
jgi:hypothetical protein